MVSVLNPPGFLFFVSFSILARASLLMSGLVFWSDSVRVPFLVMSYY